MLPSEVPEELSSDCNACQILRFTGDVKVENLLLEFLAEYPVGGPSYLVQRLSIPNEKKGSNFCGKFYCDYQTRIWRTSKSSDF